MKTYFQVICVTLFIDSHGGRSVVLALSTVISHHTLTFLERTLPFFEKDSEMFTLRIPKIVYMATINTGLVPEIAATSETGPLTKEYRIVKN